MARYPTEEQFRNLNRRLDESIFQLNINQEIEDLKKLLRRSEKRRKRYEEDSDVMYEKCGEFIENAMNGGSFNNFELMSRSELLKKIEFELKM
ncbi:unnamed protein product [Caenorhabditis angaria]|uniref:Uncharacterized protein n=1 Tax=Caenorhabditis angaria TaxID=860376 RepID=A0A9P1I3V8_9PELO|nr:unnamed protein product [Caenorhabditis angaria]